VIEINRDVIPLININLEAVVFKLLSDLANRSLVWLDGTELVDDGYLKLAGLVGADRLT